MKKVTLRNTSEDGKNLTVTYLPEMGMNMISYKKDDLDVIDQSTQHLFDERFAGLGALIGPHFHRRLPQILPKIENPKAFPHIPKNSEVDPFSHGLGRYAPWQFECDETSIRATLKGDDSWNDIPIKELEGQNFTMTYHAKLSPKGLSIEMSVVSESDSIVGIHYYYHLPKGEGVITTKVKEKYIDKNEIKNIPSDLGFDKDTNTLSCSLNRDLDYTFHPYPDPTVGEIILDAVDYKLKTQFIAPSEECSFQLWHPKGASFVCIEPNTAQDPRHPNLSVSSIKINLQII
ncbi:MAG: hypothetical protein VX777_09520 [Chlamydiota bacterium]|nr:hypothetical protein [Chlamydiota bacterium]